MRETSPTVADIVARIRPVMPPAVRDVIDQAEQGGPARFWLAGDRGVALVECGRMLNEPRVPVEVVGWLVAITMFTIREQQLASALSRTSFRDEIVPVVLEAFATIALAGQSATARLWTSIEMLVGRIKRATVPARFHDALPLGLRAQSAIRGCALRLATELGAPARAAIEAANAREPSPHLSSALVTLAGGEPAVANPEDSALLGKLLAAWRDTLDPELEKPIVRLGAELARARGPIDAPSRSELEGAWRAIAKLRDPIDLSRLLDAPWPSTWKRARERVDLLALFPPDPRLALRLVEVARTYPSAGAVSLHRRIAAVIATSPTPTIRAGLDAIAAGPAGLVLGQAYVRARQTIEALATRPADPALLAQAHAGDRPDLDAIAAQLAGSPGDVETRAVLADALQLAGDPRGEFITLQLAIAEGTASAAAERRAAALLAAHGDAWMGPLPAIDRATRRFERGFVVAVTTTATGSQIASSLAVPEWATIEELTVVSSDVDLAPLVARLPLLRRLCADRAALERLALARPTPRVRAVFARSVWMPPVGAFPELAVVGTPALRGDYGHTALVRFQRDAAELGVHAIAYLGVSRLASVIAARTAGPPETRITLQVGPVEFDPPGWRIRVRRDEPIADAAWVYHRYQDAKDAELFEPLASAGVRRVALWFPEALSSHRDRLIGERPFGLEVVAGGPIDLVAPT